MSAEHAVQAAVADVIAYSIQAELPLKDVVCKIGEESLKATFLFQTVESYGIVMRDTARKDKLIEAFMRSLTANHFSFGEHPRLSFFFSIDA